MDYYGPYGPIGPGEPYGKPHEPYGPMWWAHVSPWSPCGLMKPFEPQKRQCVMRFQSC